MILSKTYFILIMVLLVHTTKNIFGFIQDDVDKICTDAIREHFLVGTKHERVKTYCLHGLYNFRLSRNPENGTFIDPEGKHNKYAEEYYKWLLQFIEIGSSVKTPEEFCNYHGRHKSAKFRSLCKESKKDLFKWMYYNLTKAEILKSDVLHAYVKHVAHYFQIDDKTFRPASFCRHYYNRV